MRISRRLIDITGLRDIIQRRIPVLVAESRRPGPVVWLTACIHGDEVGGTAIVHDVFARLRKEGLSRGSVHAFPLINSMGFENVSRYINTDREDLNRCFPGDPRGSLGEQIARRLYDTIMKSEPSLVIDLHNDWIQSIPYILLDPPQA
ncbi:MAG: succinylglutamate desuccinylase/aspartoacylase family protein, partial [Gammaproteobacteria bacterium]|nr:succinylglutamate desuccinylase/aspartoacylase family protein [Gammaproteobacteria bacterium]